MVSASSRKNSITQQKVMDEPERRTAELAAAVENEIRQREREGNQDEDKSWGKKEGMEFWKN